MIMIIQHDDIQDYYDFLLKNLHVLLSSFYKVLYMIVGNVYANCCLGRGFCTFYRIVTFVDL